MAGIAGVHFQYCCIGARPGHYLIEARYDVDAFDRLAKEGADLCSVQIREVLVVPREFHLLVYGDYRATRQFFAELLKEYGQHYKDRVDRCAPFGRPFHNVIRRAEFAAVSQDMLAMARREGGEVRHWRVETPLLEILVPKKHIPRRAKKIQAHKRKKVVATKVSTPQIPAVQAARTADRTPLQTWLARKTC